MTTNSTPSDRYRELLLPRCLLPDESLYVMMRELRSAGVKIKSDEELTGKHSIGFSTLLDQLLTGPQPAFMKVYAKLKPDRQSADDKTMVVPPQTRSLPDLLPLYNTLLSGPDSADISTLANQLNVSQPIGMRTLVQELLIGLTKEEVRNMVNQLPGQQSASVQLLINQMLTDLPVVEMRKLDKNSDIPEHWCDAG